MEVDEGSNLAAHAFLKNEFTEDEKYHNLMSWLILTSVLVDSNVKSTYIVYLSRLMTKLTKWHVRPTKTQISLGIRPV